MVAVGYGVRNTNLDFGTRQSGGNDAAGRELRTDCGELGLVCGVDENGALGCI